jgi:hypothetical protein
MNEAVSNEVVQELSTLPALHNRWVAIDTAGRRRNDRLTPLYVALKSGAIVVDADSELDELCSRLRDAGQTALTILFAGTRN